MAAVDRGIRSEVERVNTLKMNLDWVAAVMAGLISDETIDAIVNDFEAYKNLSLLDLGLSSMAVMGVVINIETQLGVAIDYETFDLANIATLARVRSFLDGDVPDPNGQEGLIVVLR